MDPLPQYTARESLPSPLQRIAILTDWGKQIGMGHRVRMGALADACNTLFGSRIDFFQTTDEPADYSPYDLLILDSYLLSDERIAKLHDEVKTLLCYDDNALFTYDCDIILNANPHASELTIRTSSPPPVLLLGGDFALLREQFWNTEPIDVKVTASRAFVCFGGTDLNCQTRLVVEALQRITGLQLSVVVGRDAPSYDELVSTVDERVRVFRDPQSIAAIMQECDIAIISSGSIVYEIAALGIPALTIIQAKNQEIVANYLSAKKLMRNLGYHDEVDCESIQHEANSLLLDYNRRKDESEKLNSLVNRKGALNAAAEIARIMHESSR